VNLALVQSLKVVITCATTKPHLAFHWSYQSEQTDCQFSDICTQKLLKQTNKKWNVAKLSLILVVQCCEVVSLPVLGGPLEEG